MGLSGWIDSAAQIAAGAVIASAWQGLLLAALVWLSLKLAPRISASIRFAIWGSVFVAILLLPGFSMKLGGGATAAGGIASGASYPVLQLDSRWALAIMTVWAVLSIARSIGLARGAFLLRGVAKSSTPLEVDASLKTALETALERTGRPGPVQVCGSAEIDQPCVLGFFKPRILIPDWLLEKATPGEMRQIVLHEASHLRRWDHWTNLVQKLALIVFPLNPALAWTEKRLCSEREEACDESVVRQTQSPREYACCLTNLAAQRMERRMSRRMQQRSAALSLGAWEHRSALAGRVHSILRRGKDLSPVKARALMAALVLATAAGAVELGRSSQLVAFTHSETRTPAQFADQIANTLPSAGYHDIAFRERVPAPYTAESEMASSPPAMGSRHMARSVGMAARKAAIPSDRPEAREPDEPAIRRASLSLSTNQSATETRSWIIVTRWESFSDSQSPVMVIQSVVGFSAPSADVHRVGSLYAVRAPSGWFVVQL